MPAPGPGRQTFEGVAERRVFVRVDDAGAAVDRFFDEDLLDVGSVSPFCHCALDEEIRTGIFSAFAARARPTTLLLYSAREEKSRTPAIRPIWWSMKSMMAFCGVGFS
jgi:hypothetical protein